MNRRQLLQRLGALGLVAAVPDLEPVKRFWALGEIPKPAWTLQDELGRVILDANQAAAAGMLTPNGGIRLDFIGDIAVRRTPEGTDVDGELFIPLPDGGFMHASAISWGPDATVDFNYDDDARAPW